jgi:hypothetical protein
VPQQAGVLKGARTAREKVLVFSQSIKTLDAVQAMLQRLNQAEGASGLTCVRSNFY